MAKWWSRLRTSGSVTVTVGSTQSPPEPTDPRATVSATGVVVWISLVETRLRCPLHHRSNVWQRSPCRRQSCWRQTHFQRSHCVQTWTMGQDTRKELHCWLTAPSLLTRFNMSLQYRAHGRDGAVRFKIRFMDVTAIVGCSPCEPTLNADSAKRDKFWACLHSLFRSC